jgi:lipoyl(octanoyl) transferase
MARQLGVLEVEMNAVERAVAESFAEVFEASLEEGDFALRTISVCVWKRDGDDPKILLLRRTAARGGFWQIVTGRPQPGESSIETAARELKEETGFALKLNPLGYTHAFNFQKRVPPAVAEETAFSAFLPSSDAVQLDPEEHDAYEWVSPEEAERRLPFKGLRNAARLSLAEGPPGNSSALPGPQAHLA